MQNERQLTIARANTALQCAIPLDGSALLITVTCPTSMTWEVRTPTRDRATAFIAAAVEALTGIGTVTSRGTEPLLTDPQGPQRVTIMMTL